MKVSKKTGKVKLEADEVRVGNFFVKREDDHMKITDLNSVLSFRASRAIPIGIWLENVWARAVNGEEVALDTLKTYISTKWLDSSVVPDDEYINDSIERSRKALDRHPDWYGIKSDATEEDDAEAVSEVEGMMSFGEEMRKAMEEEKHED